MPRIVRGAGHPLLADDQLVAALLRIDRTTGHVVTDHRTSWVRRITVEGRSFFVKVYEYSTWRSRWRDAGRWTAPWSRSRAAAEFDALTWLRAHHLPGPEPLLVGERRRLGFLASAVVVTMDFGGDAADRWLERLDDPARRGLAEAIGRLVGSLHRLGFRDRNLDLRNLLARRGADGSWIVAKIDSPRHRLRKPMCIDRLARADWHRLLPQLAALGLDAVARAAADGVSR